MMITKQEMAATMPRGEQGASDDEKVIAVNVRLSKTEVETLRRISKVPTNAGAVAQVCRSRISDEARG